MKVFAIPIFQDNYVWVLHQGPEAAVVDPGDAAPVQEALAARGLDLRAILITHWHPDHIGGLPALSAEHRVPVYGPLAEAERIPGLTRTLRGGDSIEVLGARFEVLDLAGHTLGHIGYRSGDVLLCGDTLFSAGCGRLFEGTPEQMWASLSRLAALPPETRVFCTHEYTLANLAFAQALEPDNPDIRAHLTAVKDLRAAGQPSLPSQIALERRINPFLRCRDAAEFAEKRRQKDRFKA